jgi:hypothetical protein
MANKPTAAFVLVLIGGIIILLGALLGVGALLSLSSINNGLSSTFGSSYNSSVVGVVGAGITIGLVLDAASVIAGIIMIIASLKLNNTDVNVVKKWSIVALIFTLVSLTTLGGFIIGFILGLIGSILGLTYKG